MAKLLIDKVCVITGGASGIGAATVRRCLREGAKVVIADVQAETGHALATELGRDTTFVKCDVSAEDDIASLMESASQRFGRLDVLANVAGVVGPNGPMSGIRTEHYDATMDINLRGTILGMKHARRFMSGGGSIVNVASVAGVAPSLASLPYSTSKAGVIAVTTHMAIEYAPAGIRVNAVAPGITDTAMLRYLYHGSDDVATPGLPGLTSLAMKADDIADVVAFLASDWSRAITGQTIVADKGLLAGVRDKPEGLLAMPTDFIHAGGRTGPKGDQQAYPGLLAALHDTKS